MNLVEAAFIQVSGFQISPQPLEHSVDLVAKKMKATENHFFFFNSAESLIQNEIVFVLEVLEEEGET